MKLAGAGDVQAIRSLVDAAYGKYVALIGRKPMPMTADYEALVAAQRVWLLKEGADLAGVLVLVDKPDHLLLENVCVAPSRQGQGTGRRLLEFTEQEARRRGFAEVRLYTNAKFVENIALYTRHGYEETHRGGQDGFERCFMRKRIAR